MIAVDTSIAVAAFADWHTLNDAGRAVLADGAQIPSHAMLETYSVLTRLPPPQRVRPAVVQTWLSRRFPRALPSPDESAQRALIDTLAADRRTGGTIYDALVGVTALQAGAELVTADRRAVATYDVVGVRYRLVDA